MNNDVHYLSEIGML